MLKNTCYETLIIKYDGRQYPVEPGCVFDVKTMAPIGVISDHEAICIEENWSKETGKRLRQISAQEAQEAPKKEEPKPIIKDEVKAEPAKPEPVRPAVKKEESSKKKGKR